MIPRRLATLVLSALAAFSFGAQVQYAQKSTPIRAGVLIIDSYQISGKPANGTPFVWYNLNASSNLKPSGWSFVNPHAATVMTQAIIDRWNGVDGLSSPPPAGVGGSIAGLNQTLTKGTAPYWEVFLGSASDEQLADYDILALNVRGYLSLTPFEREKLRSYVDQGGVLWVDVDQTTNFDAINNIPLAVDKSSLTPGVVGADLGHPLLSKPIQLSLSQVTLMETDVSSGLQAVDPTNYGAASLLPILETLQPEFQQIQTVAADSSGVLIGVGRIGDGSLVVTARGVANALNAGVNNPANNRFFAETPARNAASDAAASLVINAINLGASYREPFRGSRKQNSSPVDLQAPLLKTFFASLPLSPGNKNFVPPATYKGLFVVSGSDRIYVYDGNPSSDLDGDGNPDDGLADSDLSAGLDLLWVSAAMPGPISSPACLGIENPTAPAIKDQILVVDANGTVHAFNPFAYFPPDPLVDLNNISEAYHEDPPGGPAAFDMGEDGRGPFAPTIHNDLAYISDVQSGVSGKVGRAWILDPSTGFQLKTGPNAWTVGGSSSAGIPEVSNSPTVGYIPIQDNSGGEDLVMYLPTRPNPAALGSPDSTAGIVSLWLGAKGERPTTVQVVGGNLEVSTRANLAGLKIYTGVGSDRLGLKVSVFHTSSGDPLTATEMAGVFSGSVTQGPDGVLQLGLGPSGWQPDYTLRIDYMIDWGSGSLTLTEQVRRGTLFFPDAARTRRIIGPVALGANGNFFVTVSDQTKGGALYALREEGRGLFVLLYRYELYDQHNISLNMASPVTYRETFLNEDGLNSLVPFFAGPMTQLTMQGSPSVRNGMVFATASAQAGPFNLPMTILMAFSANPQPVRVPVGNMTDTFVLVQPDIARSVNPTDPETYTIMQSTQFEYSQQGATGYVRIPNMMASRTGQIQQALSSSQPVVLRRNGAPDQLIDPDAVGGHWSPLIWYTILSGTSNQSPPMVTGNTVFVAGNSKTPDILAGVSPLTATDRGVMFAMDADVQPLPPDAFPNSVRPWMNQVPLLRVNSGNITANKTIRWPQASGVTTFEDWKLRYFQTALRSGDTSYGIAAGEGALFTWGPSTIYGFARGELLIADEGRLLRLDASGNPLWASDTSIGSGSSAQGTTTSTVKNLLRPVRAYRLGADQVVVADPSGNRIVRMNLGGKEIRSVTGFFVDPNYVPDGYVAGAPLKLNGPTDIAVYSAYIPAAKNNLSSPSALEYWVYYMVADSANKRILEIVDRYLADPSTREIGEPVVVNGQRQLGVLTWHSPSNYTGKDFRYNTVARVFNPATGLFTYAGGLGNATPTRVDLGLDTPTSSSRREASLGSGGIVLFDGAQTQLINEIVIPPIAANAYWNDSTASFSSAARQQRTKPIGDLRSVTMRYVTEGGNTRLAVMFTDASGVYEVYQPVVGADQPWMVRWMLPKEMYKAMRRTGNVPNSENPRDLNAMFARRLDSGEVMLVNGYLGQMRGNSPRTPFSGEVVVLDGDFDASNTNAIPGFSLQKENLGFNSLSVKLKLAQLTGVRSINAPVFADLR